MRAPLSVLLLVAPLVAGCDVTAVNPAACKLKDADFCGAGMYCDQTLNACMPGSASPDAGTPATCNAAQFCTFTASAPTGDLNALFGSSNDDIWAVGNAGATLHWDGKTWQSVPSPVGVNLRGVWGDIPSRFYAVGDTGVILRWSGSAWTKQQSGTTANLRAITGYDASRLWAVGDGGTMLLSTDGSTWLRGSNPHTNDLYGAYVNYSTVTGQTGYSILGLGDQSDLIRIDINNMQAGTALASSGSLSLALYAAFPFALDKFLLVGQAGQMTLCMTGACQPQTAVTSFNLFGAWQNNVGSGWVVGDGGTVLNIQASGTQLTTSQLKAAATPLYAVWGKTPGNTFWIVGAGGIILHYPGLPN